MLEMNWAPLVGAAIITAKAWDALPPEAQEAMRKSAVETGKLLKIDGRRENAESIVTMQKRGLKVHPLTSEVEAQWEQEAEKAYAKIRGIVIPADIYDEVTNQLKTFRSGQPAAGK